MGLSIDKYLRIAFIISRSSLLTREWFRGTMRYARRNPKWFVRLFETGYGEDAENFDMGGTHPDGIITFASGFGSLSGLKTLFQKKFGISMREYRKQAQKLT